MKAFLTFTYKIEIKEEKKKREKGTHTYLVQIEEYQAKHTHKAITAIQLPRKKKKSSTRSRFQSLVNK